MSNHKTYTQALAKLAALVEQQKSVSANLHSNAQKQQAAQKHLHEATERAAALRVKVVRGIASDEELEEADTLSEKLFAQAALEELQGDEKICRAELNKLESELMGARTAVSAALQKLCSGIAEQLGASLKNNPKLRAQLVDIYAAYSGFGDSSLGGSPGGRVDWGMMLEEIFPTVTDAEFEAAYDRFKSNLQK